MAVVTSTVKGQILIPAPLRKKYKIEKGTRIHIFDDGKRIIIEPIQDDPVLTGRGMLKTRGKVLRSLLSDRKQEAEL
jgi:AbrB family looped-hinge helix DNA binding protein